MHPSKLLLREHSPNHTCHPSGIASLATHAPIHPPNLDLSSICKIRSDPILPYTTHPSIHHIYHHNMHTTRMHYSTHTYQLVVQCVILSNIIVLPSISHPFPFGSCRRSKFRLGEPLTFVAFHGLHLIQHGLRFFRVERQACTCPHDHESQSYLKRCGTGTGTSRSSGCGCGCGRNGGGGGGGGMITI